MFLEHGRQIFQAAGLESITDAIDNLTPAERGKDLAQGIIKAQQESRESLKGTIEGKVGGKGGTSRGAAGPDASYFGKLSEHLSLLTRGMEATIAGDKALASKLRKSSAELIEETS